MNKNNNISENLIPHPYLTTTELDFIENNYFNLRRSDASRKNMFYLLSTFSNYTKKPLFDALPQDADSYINHLKKQLQNGTFKENYCCCVFLELRKFYEYAEDWECIDQNPFQAANPFQTNEKLLAADLPSLQDIDTLLSICADEPMLYLAVLLAFRMALPISEIVSLKKEQVCSEHGRQDIYLRMERQAGKKEKTSFLLIPEDILLPLKQTILSTEESYPYILRNKHGRPYAKRSLQNLLATTLEGSGISIHFSALRSLCLFLMLIEKVPVGQIADYAGVEGRWLTLYDHIPEKLRLDASKYVHLRIV